ncbi:MAG: nucleotidyl transferase AbiEii/AbiGii toxin family protein, partial [bacterium]
AAIDEARFMAFADGERLPTKLEFSRRHARLTATPGTPGAALLLAHGLPPFVAQHYDATALAGQKLGALAAPARHAVRDLYDLWHLFAGGKTSPEALRGLPRRVVEEASDKMRAFAWRDYEAQVLPYLAAGGAAGTASERGFVALRGAVLAALARIPA